MYNLVSWTNCESALDYSTKLYVECKARNEREQFRWNGKRETKPIPMLFILT